MVEMQRTLNVVQQLRAAQCRFFCVPSVLPALSTSSNTSWCFFLGLKSARATSGKCWHRPTASGDRHSIFEVWYQSFHRLLEYPGWDKADVNQAVDVATTSHSGLIFVFLWVCPLSYLYDLACSFCASTQLIKSIICFTTEPPCHEGTAQVRLATLQISPNYFHRI